MNYSSREGQPYVVARSEGRHIGLPLLNQYPQTC